MAIGDLIDKLTNKFTETIFYKQDSELQRQIDALNKLLEQNPNNDDLKKKLKLSELGLQGEKEIEFELKNANIGMYVLHDVNMEYHDLKAQIDYIVITPARLYFIECKNLVGNITIDNKGNFIREYQYGSKKIKEGIYSPVTQAQRHVEIFKKIWKERNTSILDKAIRARDLDNWYVPLVVLANSKNIINDRYAPQSIKKIVIKSDRLIEYLKNDINNMDKDYLSNQKEMHNLAFSIMENYNKDIDKDYEEEFLSKAQTSRIPDKADRLIEFRKKKSKEKNIPAYYIFTDQELEKILELHPKTIKELADSKILSDIKVKLHGNEIIEIINKDN